MGEHVCPPWLSFLLTNAFRRMAHDPSRILGRFLKEGDVAIDIGCGPGFFTVPMARRVGEDGLVVAVDIHSGMLEKARRRAERAGVAGRIRFHLGRRDSLGLDLTADFALAFWMTHEVADRRRLFAEVLSVLKPGGLLLLVEPRMHASDALFREIVATAEGVGFEQRGEEVVRLSRAVVLSASGVRTHEPI